MVEMGGCFGEDMNDRVGLALSKKEGFPILCFSVTLYVIV